MQKEKISFNYPSPGTLRVKLSGEWQISSPTVSSGELIAEITGNRAIKLITFDTSEITKWDSALVSLSLELARLCHAKKIDFSQDGLPQGARKLLELAFKKESKVIAHQTEDRPFLERFGSRALQIQDSLLSLLDFLGEIAVAFGNFFKGRAYFRSDDFIAIVQRCGFGALGLVSLISVMVGIILAFIGAIQLKLFGAQIYIADIVGIAMVRVMGAVMTGVIMSGRTGASFAAELGIMQTNEEIDSLKTLGVSPVEFLVLPRLIAMVLMLPLLTIYADFMGILGGYLISTGVLGINPVEYLNHTQTAVKLSNFWIGLIHSLVFGAIIAVAGCLRGMNCERSASGVGEATTSAVVTAITSIVVATAIITFICQVLGV